MIRSASICLALAIAVPVRAQETPFLASPTERGVVLRWVWGPGQRPAGYFVERRASSASPWTRLTPRPLTRIRDRAAARALVGDQFARYEGLLFPEDPGAERADPETFGSMLLLSADLDPGVAQVLGLRHEDATATSGTAYEYRLIELTASGERVAATSAGVIAGGYRPPPGPDAMAAVPGPRGAALRWAPQPRFSGYHVFRGTRRDGSDARRLNDSPVIVFTRDAGAALEASATFFTDTIPPADSAFYRVRGIDMFGRVSEASLPAAIVYRAPVTIAAPVLLQSRVQGDTVVVSWERAPDARATRHQLWRSDSAGGPFVRVGPPVRLPGREQRDPGRPSRRVTWYRVTALDDAGRESDPSALTLAEVPDREPPAPPDSVTATADNGRMSLRWRRVAAADLRGYRVYRASSADGTYGLLSAAPRMEPRFVDTIRTRADHPFYYRVTAVDSAFNESAPSAVLVARPPDATPPSPPRVADIRKLDAAVIVRWLPNPEPDVAAYRARFRLRGDSLWRGARESVPAPRTTDTLAGLMPGRVYEVVVYAVDDAGNVSPPSRPVEASAARPRGLARPDLKGAAWDARQRGVVVSWSAPAEATSVMVLRREAGGAYRAIGEAAPGAARFVDGTAQAARIYEYLIRARDAFGNEADSRARRVTIPGGGS